MSQPLKCPQCGASEANLLQDNIYQCKFCGSIYEYGDVKPVFETTVRPQKPISFDDKKLQEIPSKIIRFVIISFALMIIGFAATVIISVLHKTKTSSSVPAKLYKDNNETNSSFTLVNTKDGPQVWTISRRNSDGLKEVSYFLNKIDAKENKLLASQPIGNTITWEQSLKDAYRMEGLKPMGNICWLIYGEQLLGYDVNTQQEVLNNELLGKQFSELKNGIAKVEDVYDMDGFKFTTKDGYTYYYEAVLNKLYTEEQYEDKSSLEKTFTDKTEYCFTDEERQQLYKISRKVGEVVKKPISANIVSSLVKDNGAWYKRVYKISYFEEFTPGIIYFKASVLYFDENNIVLIYQNELGEDAPIILKCLDAGKKEIWSKTGEEAAFLKPFLKSTNATSFLNGNQLAIVQPYQLGVCLNIENGEINWSFKPY